MAKGVNYIKHHVAVNNRMAEDDLRHTHIALYNALFMIWNNAHFAKELSINRTDVMKLAKIGNANTYTKLLKDLHNKKYIVYKPSHNPIIGSKVTIIRCDKGTDKGTDISSGASTDNGGDTLYKLLNLETIKLIKEYSPLIKKHLKKWIKNEKNIKGCLFVDSEYYDYEKFRKRLEDAEKLSTNLWYYHGAIKDWSASKGEKRKDWIATARSWMRKDKQAGNLVTVKKPLTLETMTSAEKIHLGLK